MNDKSNSTIGVFAISAIVGLLALLPQAGMPGTAKGVAPEDYLNSLPPSAAGFPSPHASTSPASYLGGTKATGRVAEVYVRAAENVYVAADRAPEQMRRSSERWVDIEFPELLADEIESVRAVLEPAETGVQVGDVVEVKFAHKDNPRYFPVKELTRVTELVAKKGEMLARDFERRILARSGRAPAPAPWAAHLPAPALAPLTTAQALR